MNRNFSIRSHRESFLSAQKVPYFANFFPMKKIFNPAAVLLTLYIILFSCTKSSSPEPVAAEGQLIATIGNTAWESSDAYILVDNKSINLVAVNNVGASIQLQMLLPVTTGTYKILASIFDTPEATVSFTQDGVTIYQSINYTAGTQVGTIVVTEIDEINSTVSGKFNVKMKQLFPTEKEVILKSGSFTKIHYYTSAPQTVNLTVGDLPFEPSTISGSSSLGTITLNFSTTDLSPKSISIVVPDNITVGTHTLGTSVAPYYGVYSENGYTYTSQSGTITITTHNTTTKRIIGSFSFTPDPNSSSPPGSSFSGVIQGAFEISYN
jgi:hypothetical protein